MKIYEYDDYDHYVAEQTKANKRKIHWLYVKKHTIKHISKLHPFAATILCHGTRNGGEMDYFEEFYPAAEILGTEISETATQFKRTVQWDFAHVKEEWIGKWDIVYSNSFDHSIDPMKTLDTWKNQLSENGKMFIEYSEAHSKASIHDPLEATHQEFKKMLSDSGLIQFSETIVGKREGSLLYALQKV